MRARMGVVGRWSRLDLQCRVPVAPCSSDKRPSECTRVQPGLVPLVLDRSRARLIWPGKQEALYPCLGPLGWNPVVLIPFPFGMAKAGQEGVAMLIVFLGLHRGFRDGSPTETTLLPGKSSATCRESWLGQIEIARAGARPCFSRLPVSKSRGAIGNKITNGPSSGAWGRKVSVGRCCFDTPAVAK